MDKIKGDIYFAEKIIQDVEFIMKHTENLSKEEFEVNELLQDSMMFRLIQISEISLRLSDEFKEKYNTIPWFAIKGLRNRIVHDYGNVDLTVVYITITVDIPEVNRLLQRFR